MAEHVEAYANGDNNDAKINDESIDIACENPFVKFVRGFSNVPDESVRKMRFELFYILMSEIPNKLNVHLTNRKSKMYAKFFRDSDLMQKDWSALSDDDLKLFGLENDMLRQEMLVKFANTPNQTLHHDKLVLIYILILLMLFFFILFWRILQV